MRKVVLKMHVSLDGYVRAASGDVMDWVFRTYDDELKAWEVDTLWQAGTHIMGRNGMVNLMGRSAESAREVGR